MSRPRSKVPARGGRKRPVAATTPSLPRRFQKFFSQSGEFFWGGCSQAKAHARPLALQTNCFVCCCRASCPGTRNPKQRCPGACGAGAPIMEGGNNDLDKGWGCNPASSKSASGVSEAAELSARGGAESSLHGQWHSRHPAARRGDMPVHAQAKLGCSRAAGNRYSACFPDAIEAIPKGRSRTGVGKGAKDSLRSVWSSQAPPSPCCSVPRL